MADLERVRAKIREIAGGNRKNVSIDDIRWVVVRLGINGYEVNERKTIHQMLFRVGHVRFGVCVHNPGNRHVKRCYVDEFVRAMIDWDLYED